MDPRAPESLITYAYLAWHEIFALAARHGRSVEPVPTLLAALLNHHGNVGPAEVPAKRVYVFKDVLRHAARLGLPLEPFVLAVLFGANLSFATPMAYQTNILLMNAGGYKFGDFVRIGLPLSIGLWLVLTTVLVWAYGL